MKTYFFSRFSVPFSRPSIQFLSIAMIAWVFIYSGYSEEKISVPAPGRNAAVHWLPLFYSVHELTALQENKDSLIDKILTGQDSPDQLPDGLRLAISPFEISALASEYCSFGDELSRLHNGPRSQPVTAHCTQYVRLQLANAFRDATSHQYESSLLRLEICLALKNDLLSQASEWEQALGRSIGVEVIAALLNLYEFFPPEKKPDLHKLLSLYLAPPLNQRSLVMVRHDVRWIKNWVQENGTEGISKHFASLGIDRSMTMRLWVETKGTKNGTISFLNRADKNLASIQDKLFTKSVSWSEGYETFIVGSKDAIISKLIEGVFTSAMLQYRLRINEQLARCAMGDPEVDTLHFALTEGEHDGHPRYTAEFTFAKSMPPMSVDIQMSDFQILKKTQADDF